MDLHLIKVLLNPLNWYELYKQLRGERFNSVAEDTRSLDEQSKDYMYGDDVILPYAGTGTKVTKLPFVAYDQKSTSACGAFAASHARLVHEGAVNYPLPWYRDRTNYSGKGMYLQDVLKLAALANEVAVPKKTPAYTEKNANALDKIELYNNERGSKYAYTKIAPYDVYAVIDAVMNGYPTIISFYSTINEWDEKVEEKDVVTLYTAPVRHFVTALPNSIYEEDGKMWVSVVDSSPNKGYSLRQISLEFLSRRMYIGGGFYFPVETKKVKRVLNRPINRCSYGDENLQVLDLQTFLYEEGYMDSKYLTGYYGPITAKAVLKWQLDNITSIDPITLDSYKGWYWGPSSIAAVKLKYPE